ncbi:MAG: Cd(II)/Pb(II)-responsive transcriptional regulator [Desulfovibrio sp.]|nr:Cd(II)/Pb(II)-responsive transcriptional regulator [Desulfovibrio sp.]
MKIGGLAKKTGCKVVTIRYYEKEGLLPEPERTEGNYRLYGKNDLERLQFIMHCRKHGLKPVEIKKLLAFKDHPQGDCTWVSELISAHIKNIDAQIDSLEHLKQHLNQLRQCCAGGHSGDRCGIMHSLNSLGQCCASCARCSDLSATPQCIHSTGPGRGGA